MRILIFQHTYFPFVGGAEVAVKEITDRLGETSPDHSLVRIGNKKLSPLEGEGLGEVFQFDLITARLDKSLTKYEKIGNVNVYRVGLGWKLDKYFYPLLAFRKAVKLHKEKRYDIAQGIMATWGGIAAMLFKMRHKDVKYLLTEQSGDSDFFIWIRTWFWYPVYKMVYTKSDFIQPISRWLEKRARRYGYDGELKIVPNGVNIHKFKVQSSKFKVRGQMGIGNDERIIITASRLVEKNGVEDLIRAIKELRINPASSAGQELRIKGKEVKLLIAGTGKLESKFKKLVKKLGLRDIVIFLGHISQEELPKYLCASDIFCRPSLSEGQGISFLEAMASGIPIIATQVGGIPDFLEDGKTGIFCKVRDPKSIAKCVIRLLSDKLLYDKIAENGRRLVEEKYDWENIAFQIRGIYKKLS